MISSSGDKNSAASPRYNKALNKGLSPKFDDPSFAGKNLCSPRYAESQNRTNMEGLRSCPRLHSSKMYAMEAMNDL